MATAQIHSRTLDEPEDSGVRDEREYRRSILVVRLGFSFVLLVVLLVLLLLYLASYHTPNENPTPVPVATGVPVTPTPAFDPASWPVEVWNGSGTAGIAGVTAESLRGLGFPVVDIGNAERNDYRSTQVLLADPDHPEAEMFLERIRSTLPSASVSGALTGTTASARIIVGRQ